jgi:preprotein translocase SecE subunit
MNKVTRYFKGVGEEAKRIRWPDQKTLWKAVGIVLLISIVSAGSIALSDWLAIQIMKGFTNAFPSNSTSTSSTSAAAANIVAWFINGGLLK